MQQKNRATKNVINSKCKVEQDREKMKDDTRQQQIYSPIHPET